MTAAPLAFAPGIDIAFDESALSFQFGPGVFGPPSERRALASIRASLLDPQCDGPDPVYGICMDMGREGDRGELERRWLLFGAVGYAPGCLGSEPVRSQGHVHAIAPHSGWSPPELFEVWQGRAIVYMQENDGAEPGRCFAVIAEPGEHVIVPPGWPHYVANGDPRTSMAFGALCDRQYGFVYDGVRSRGGLAWFPICEEEAIFWKPNPAYATRELIVGSPRVYSEFGVLEHMPLYRQFEQHAETLQWVSDPARVHELWSGFHPVGEVRARYSRT